MTTLSHRGRPGHPDHPRLTPHPPDPAAVAAHRLAPFLGLAALVSAAGSLFFPDLLSGAPVTVGNLRGTALVVLVVGVPMLAAGAARARRGSVRGLVVWLGATAYLTYQGVMFCFGTPINALFLPYVALLALGVWSLAALVTATAAAPVLAAPGPRTPWRPLAGLLATFAVLNGLAWIARAAPVTWTGDRPDALAGSGLLTSPVWVQDLAFWVPAAVVVAVLTWRHSPRGAVLAGGMLAFYVVECLSVASDQWWGVRADDDHPAVASMSAVPGGVVLALLTAAALAWLLSHVDGVSPRRVDD
ncbi:MAG TPA: hypothetical protein VD864_08730 [Nocardioides sp.]|nr:hypothetical protein [Nocardioides sp.]